MAVPIAELLPQTNLTLLRDAFPTEPARFAIPRNATRLLDEAVEYQQGLEASGAFKNFSADSNMGILDAFVRSPLFLDSYSQIVKLAFKIENDTKFKTRVRGRVFESMCYEYFVPDQEKGTALTSPRDTKAFFNALEGGSTFIDEEGEEAVNSIYIPDGLKISKNESGYAVDGVYEYKLSYEAVRDQLKNFREVKTKLGTMLNDQDLKLTFVFPSGRNDYPNLPSDKADILLLPVTDGQFSVLVEQLIGKCRITENSATIEEIRSEHRRQISLRHPEISIGEPSQAIFSIKE